MRPAPLLAVTVLLSACGGSGALDSVTVTTLDRGTWTLRFTYDEERVVGAVAQADQGDPVTWTIAVDDDGRLLRLARGNTTLHETTYLANAAHRDFPVGSVDYTLDGNRIVVAEGGAGIGTFLADYDGEQAHLHKSGAGFGVFETTIARSGGECGTAILSRTPVPFEAQFVCEGDTSTLSLTSTSEQVMMVRGSHDQLATITVLKDGRGQEELQLTWRDDGAVGPRLSWESAFAVGEHLDGRGYFDLGPRWLALDVYGLLVGSGLAAR